MNPLDDARRHYGAVFNELCLARESVNAAWYHVEDKQALKAEEVQRLQSIMKQAQKAIAEWEAR